MNGEGESKKAGLPRDLRVRVTVHGLGTGSFFGPFRAEKCACPLPGQGDSPIFADFVAKMGQSP